MIRSKQLKVFNVLPAKTFQGYIDLIHKYLLDPINTSNVATTFGWEKDNIFGMHYEGRGFHFSRLTCLIKSVPTKLLDRHVRHKLNELESQGVHTDSAGLARLTEEIRASLALDIPPEVIYTDIIYFDSGKIWIGGKDKSAIDYGEKYIRFLLEQAKIDLKSEDLNCSESFVKDIALGKISDVSCTGNFWIKFGNQTYKMFYDPDRHENIEKDLKSSSIVRLNSALNSNPLIDVCITAQGKIHSIKTTDQFDEKWREKGDQADASELDDIALRVWVEAMQEYLRDIRSTWDAYQSSIDQSYQHAATAAN